MIGVVYKMKLNVGAIGYKNHAKKILEIFREKNFENAAGKLLVDKFGWEKFARKEFEAIMEAD